METKRNLKYFTAPAISVISIIGWVIVAFGVFFMASARIFGGLVITVVGIGFIVVVSGGKSTDTDLEFQISERIKDLQEQSEKKHEVYEKHFLKLLRPINLRGYDFLATETPFYYRKGQDGVERTNYFIGANLIFTNEKMVVYSRRFSLLDESIDSYSSGVFYFNELDKAEVEEKIYEYKKGDKDMKSKYYIFKILKTDGTSAVEMCVDYGADIDKYEEQITRVIFTRKRELEKRAAEVAERRAAFRAKVEAEKAAEAAGNSAE